MEGNPYARIIGVVRGETQADAAARESIQGGVGAAPMKARLGTVTQRVPLKIRVAGIEQPTEVLRINERLVKGARWRMKLTSPQSAYSGLVGALDGPISCLGGHGAPRLGKVTGGQLYSGDTAIDEASVEQLEIDLEVGDQVLTLTEDDQIFYIIMKVVDAV